MFSVANARLEYASVEEDIGASMTPPRILCNPGSWLNLTKSRRAESLDMPKYSQTSDNVILFCSSSLALSSINRSSCVIA